MSEPNLPTNLKSIHLHEEALRKQAIKIIQCNPGLILHVDVIERAMTIANLIREYPTDDEDIRVVQMLSIRIFNAFAASFKLLLSGYHQKSAMIMRDILETVFLMDLFSTDKSAIEEWRNSDKKKRRNFFSPASVRKKLDERDGFNNMKRAKAYEMLSELASHPTMYTQNMLKKEMDGDILTGPFMGNTILRQGLEELAKNAVQAGEIINLFLPQEWDPENIRENFKTLKNNWIKAFYNFN